MDRLSALEAVALYESLAEVFGKPIRVGVRPVRWSPATLKELASEAFRRQNFIAEWVAAGGLANFGQGKKFDGGVLRRVTEEDYAGFRRRIAKWAASNPRSEFPPLPEAGPEVSSDDDSVSSGGGGGGGEGDGNDDWSVEDYVKRSGNGKSA